MGNLVIIDTSIFIDHLRTACHEEWIRSLTGIIRTSAVVLAELWRGATKAGEQRFLRALARNHPILAPTERNWQESGQILGKIYKTHGFTPDKLRDLHFDALIALTARSRGARVITSNRAHYELLRTYRHFALEVW